MLRMTSSDWGRLDPFGVAEVAPFRDAEELLHELVEAVASLADGNGRVLQGEPSPLVAAFEARLQRSLRPAFDEPSYDDDLDEDGKLIDEDDDDLEGTGDRDAFADDDEAPPPLLATALDAWGLDLAGRWSLAVCLAWELAPRLHEELAATVQYPAITVDGLARLLGDHDLAATTQISRALATLQRLELVCVDGVGPWFQRSVRATDAALALAMAASPTELWAVGRRRTSALCDPRLLEALHPEYIGPALLLRGAAAALLAIEEAAAELGTPILVGGPGRERSLGAAMRDALASGLPVVLHLESADAWAAAARYPWPARTLLLTDEPAPRAGKSQAVPRAARLPVAARAAAGAHVRNGGDALGDDITYDLAVELAGQPDAELALDYQLDELP